MQEYLLIKLWMQIEWGDEWEKDQSRDQEGKFGLFARFINIINAISSSWTKENKTI